MAVPYNVGLIDRVIRFITGIVLIYLGFYEKSLIPDPIFAVLVGVFGIINLVTAIIGWCPLYHLIKFDTHTAESKD